EAYTVHSFSTDWVHLVHLPVTNGLINLYLYTPNETPAFNSLLLLQYLFYNLMKLLPGASELVQPIDGDTCSNSLSNTLHRSNIFPLNCETYEIATPHN